MYIDDVGIVLQTVGYDDSSSVAHIFTRSSGHVSFMVTRSRSRTSPLASIPALVRPLNILSFQWDCRPTAHLARLKDVHPQHVWQTLGTDPIKASVTLLLGEFLVYALRGEGENTPLFDYVDASLQWYDTASAGFVNFHLAFLLKITRFLGVAPDVEAWTEGASLVLDTSTFVVCPLLTTDRQPLILPPADTALLMQLLLSDYSALSAIAMRRHDRARLLAAIERYYIHHIPGFPPLKSPAILSSLFD